MSAFLKFFSQIAILAAASLSSAVACEKNAHRLTESEAQKALLKAQESYLAISGLSSEFTQSSFLAALEVSESSQGTVRYLKPGMMRWDYIRPKKESFVIKDGAAWYYQPDLNQVMIDELATLTSGDLPLLFLAGVGKLQDQFRVTEACSDQQRTSLSLVPQKPGALSRVTLTVTNKSFLPSKFEVEDVSGNVNAVTLDDLKTSNLPSEADFNLTLPKGTDIQDRRRSNE